MRILFVTPYYAPEFKFGGPPQKIHSIAKGLIERGASVRVASFDHQEPRRNDEDRIEGVPVHYLPWRGRGLSQIPFATAGLRNEINEADIIQCYGIYTLLVPVAARLAANMGQPVMHEPLGMYPPRAGNRLPKRAYNWLVTRGMLNDSAAVIAASQTEAAELKAFVPAANVVYRRNGIDVEAFANLPSPHELRRAWHLRAEERVVLFVGRLSPIKNLEQLVLAFAKATLSTNAECGMRNAERLKLVLVGPAEPKYERLLRKVIECKGISDRVIFAGALYEKEQKTALAVADLFVLPSLNESFGNAAGEAVAAGVPVLLTETCGIAPIIHKRAGLAVPLGVDSLAEGMRLMLKSEVRDQMTARREEVKRELSWDEPIAQTVALYERIIAQSRK